MAAGYLHKVCAERAAREAGLSSLSGHAFVLGAHGPDPLFAAGIFPLRSSSKPEPWGRMLHRTRMGAHLMALLTSAKDAGVVLRSYAMGFLTHYALDASVHPYVYAHSYDKADNYSSPLHLRLEKHWDALYYRRDGGRGTPGYMPGLAEAKPIWPDIAALWRGALEKVYPALELTEERLLAAFSASERVNRLTHSNLGIKYGLVWLIERIAGKPAKFTSFMTPRIPSRKDIENRARKPWASEAEPDRERTEGLDELFEAAVRRAVELLCAAQAYFDGRMDQETLSGIVGNIRYDLGITEDS